MYEARKINTAYLNGVSLNFGNKLCMFLNILLKIMNEKRHTEMEVSAAVKDTIKQCSKIKTAISSGKIDTNKRIPLFQ
ncbi:hypothetical protein BDF14DRAFT_1794002 [Spinellus fusiger]|nr:hypothetical protein BDF14DRAFT_1794002 [Spinellus fusiger]